MQPVTQRKILIGGICPMTTVDYPGHISMVVFTQGCTWKCRYCHNVHLQNLEVNETIAWEDILTLLRIRKGFVEALVFSGGEPLLQEELAQAIWDVKKLGLKAAMHTCGSFPTKFAQVLPLLDWVGFDIKQTFDNYESITQVPASGALALQSLEILIDSKVDFEARRTLHESIPYESILDAVKKLSSMGVKKMAFQKGRDNDKNIVELKIFSDTLLLEDISKYFDNLYIRE
jgi:pyruvate formate lyase activating enzyme